MRAYMHGHTCNYAFRRCEVVGFVLIVALLLFGGISVDHRSSNDRNWRVKGIMTLKGGTSQACAACKYQRRKCTSECPLAPYFPADQPKRFQNAHRLFGVSNILKILKNLHPSQKSEAMSSIIYQAEVRERFPVNGCVEVIQILWTQIQKSEEELRNVQSVLAMYRQQQHEQQISPCFTNNEESSLQLGMAMMPTSHNHSYTSSNSIYNNTNYIDTKETMVNPILFQNQYGNNNNNHENSMAIHSQLIASESPANQGEAFPDYDEMQPYFDTMDDRQSYIDTKVAYDSSPESSVKTIHQSIEQVAENELKSAAACFSLTSVN